MSDVAGDDKWLKIVAAATAVVGVSAAAYWYLNREDKFYFNGDVDSIQNITVAQCRQILAGVMKSQEDMEAMMSGLLDSISAQQMSFQDVCAKVKVLQPRDPLKDYNLSMENFSQLLDLHKNNQELRPYISKLTVGTQKKEITPGSDQLSTKTVVEVHRFMVSELEEIFKELNGQRNISFTSRVVTIAAQAYIAGKVYKKHGLKSYDLECLVAKNQAELVADNDFIQLSAQIRDVMGKLVEVSTSKASQ